MTTESDIPLPEMFSIGVDIIEVKRFRDLDLKSPFINRVFTFQEIAYCFGYSDPSSHLAVIFAGKEAVTKSLSSKITLSMKSIEILHDKDGSPQVHLSHLSDIKIELSLAHSKEYAVAVAMVIPKSQTANSLLFQNLLNEKTSELLPRK
ncbi:holo-[acyl-carrier-protein] synthase [Candidatus Thorarchaeota archaeon]|nr:MAG: holo-[acyl-carrier-protein] synthase [Candidatus Thorarchaeota archaeon]